MNTIDMKKLAEIIEADDALRARLHACADTDEAARTARALASELGYTLEEPARGKKLAVSDDELGSVAGGVNPRLVRSAQELNPYSWFVSILRLLMGKDDETEENPLPDSFQPGPGGNMTGQR